jgi:hypothetical protein
MVKRSVGYFIFFILLSVSAFCQKKAQKPVIGAIRWDAWVGDKSKVGQAVQASLGAAKWHYRLPFYAQIISDSAVHIDATSPAIMQLELYYAQYAGINYWAFVTYQEADPMSLSFKNYLQSKNKLGIRFCLITEVDRWGNSNSYASNLERYAKLANHKASQRVLNGRPLLYLLGNDEQIRKNWKSLSAYRKVLNEYRKKVTAGGLNTPYIVMMGGAKTDVDSLGIDAISAYTAADWSVDSAPYNSLSQHAEQLWEGWRTSDTPCIPIVMTGTDRRPRVEHPVFWESSDMVNHPVAYQQATAAQFEHHVSSALGWIKQNKQHDPANALIIYAWNELDEGGWLIPTLSDNNTVDLSRLRSLRKILAGK